MKKIQKTIYILTATIFLFQLTACGTLMYPERRGQRGGRIDPGVAVLDGVGLLFFLIPGVIAYAVDFSTGTIYLPGTYRSSRDIKDLRQVKFDPRHFTNVEIEKAISDRTGHSVKLDASDAKVTRVRSMDEMMRLFAESRASGEKS